jgi:hypothetical protein
VEKQIAEDVDDRIVVDDVMVEFFQQMIQYLQEFPTQQQGWQEMVPTLSFNKLFYLLTKCYLLTLSLKVIESSG